LYLGEIMTVETTAELQAYLAELKTARTALLTSKIASVNGQTVTRADERWISDEIKTTVSRLNARNGNDGFVAMEFLKRNS
jgi:hypothetical protein